MNHFVITVEVFPHSTGAGQKADQEAAGPRLQEHHFHAEGVRAALDIAETFAAGIQTNPRVWQANVVAIARKARASAPPAASPAVAEAATKLSTPKDYPCRDCPSCSWGGYENHDYNCTSGPGCFIQAAEVRHG